MSGSVPGFDDRDPGGMAYFVCAWCLTPSVAPEREITRRGERVYCRSCGMAGRPDQPLSWWHRLRLWLARRR